MTEKTAIKILWIIVITAYLAFPFGKWPMFGFNLFSLFVAMLSLVKLKRLAISGYPKYVKYTMNQFKEYKHDTVTWLLVATTFFSTIWLGDYLISSITVLTLYFELEIFKVVEKYEYDCKEDFEN